MYIPEGPNYAKLLFVLDFKIEIGRGDTNSIIILESPSKTGSQSTAVNEETSKKSSCDKTLSIQKAACTDEKRTPSPTKKIRLPVIVSRSKHSATKQKQSTNKASKKRELVKDEIHHAKKSKRNGVFSKNVLQVFYNMIPARSTVAHLVK